MLNTASPQYVVAKMPFTPAPTEPEAESEIATSNTTQSTATRTRATLTVRAGAVVRRDAGPDALRRVDRPNRTAAPFIENGVVPLKRLTGGRKDLKIGHDGATYLLRITKSNKLILTKAEDETPPTSAT